MMYGSASSRSAGWNSVSRRNGNRIKTRQRRDRVQDRCRPRAADPRRDRAAGPYRGRVTGRHPGRDRREQEMQEKIADLKVRTGRLITTIRAIAAVMAAMSVLTAAVQVVNALREEMAGRTIDFGKITVRRTLCPRRLSRTWRNTGMKRSAEQIRKEINARRKI